MLLALLLAAADGGAPLSLRDVQQGDALVYDLGANGELSLRACAKNEDSVAVAVSLERDGGVPNGTWLIDRVVVDLPVKPLENPQPWLGHLEREVTTSAAGLRLAACAKFYVSHPTMHGASGPVLRCEARELILGGGLVQQAFTWFGHRGGSGSSNVTLKQVTRNSAPCPAWPRAKVTGAWRSQRYGTTFQAGSTLVRKNGSDSYFLDFLVKTIVDLPRQTPVPGTAKLGGRAVKTLTVTGSNGHVWWWLAPGELPDAPLGLRLGELSIAEPIEWSTE